MTLLECKQLIKTYDEGRNALTILNGIDFSLNENETVAIVGASGSGKSTLLHLLAGLDQPSSGEVVFQNQNWQHLNETQRARVRSQSLGFIYQFHHLLMDFSALENVALALLIHGETIISARARAEIVLEQVGLKDRIQHRVSELSGGERQRVAIARAIACKPKCILADEPTGNLDEANALRVLDLFFSLQNEYGMSIVLVTHDAQIASRAKRVMTIHQGQLK